jgi:hypothetical protein
MDNVHKNIIQEIDAEIKQLQPVMDDYDGGMVAGLRKAREIVIKYNQLTWDDIHGGSEYSEFRTVDGGNF